MKRRTLLKSLLAIFGLGTAKVAATPASDDEIVFVVGSDHAVAALRGRRIKRIVIDEFASTEVVAMAHDCTEHVVKIDKRWPLPPMTAGDDRTYGLPYWTQGS